MTSLVSKAEVGSTIAKHGMDIIRKILQANKDDIHSKSISYTAHGIILSAFTLFLIISLSFYLISQRLDFPEQSILIPA